MRAHPTAKTEFMGNPFIGSILAAFDSDRDGKLDVNDFRKAVRHLKDDESLDDKYKLAFGVYDVDGDGLVSPRDLASWVSRSVCARYRRRSPQTRIQLTERKACVACND